MSFDITDFVAKVISETPEGTVIWRTVSHPYTREEMLDEIECRSEVGKQYVTELMRVSRDLVARSSVREAVSDHDEAATNSGMKR